MTDVKLHDRPLVFNTEQTQQLDRCLLHLADQTGAPLVMLSDVSGRLVLYRGRLPSAQSVGLAALAAGSFAAGLEIGNFLGLPKSFQQQLLEGPVASLYTLAVGPELLLILAFTHKTTLGMIRLFAQQAHQELLTLASAAALAREATAHCEVQLEEGFDEALKSQLDDLFANDEFSLG